IRQGGGTGDGTAQLVAPPPAYRTRRSTYTDTPIPPDESAAENPPDGAIIDYFLASPVSGTVTLEIVNGKGGVVRRYSSGDKPELTEDERAKGLIPLYWLQPPRVLSTDAGWHRWVWDLRYAPPISTEHEYPISAVQHATPRYPLGPLVLPGNYTVRLTIDRTTRTASLTVKMDPRVTTSTEGLRKKFELEMQLADAITESSKAVMQARSAQEQLERLEDPASPMKEALESGNGKISELLDGTKEAGAQKDEPVLKNTNNALIALYKEVEKADAEPTGAQLDA